MSDRPADSFQTTRWTQILAARGESPAARHALRDLCEAYYGPVEAFVKRYRSGHDDARDLTHTFFARLLEGNSLGNLEPTRGRFRSYLLGAVKHFLADQRDRALAAKRGTSLSIHSLETLEVADLQGFPPDASFDHQWALAIVEKAMNDLRDESKEGEESRRFEVLSRWLVPPEDPATASEAARSLDMTDGAFKVAVHRIRKRFRVLVKDQIASTVDGPETIQAELDYLIQALIAPSRNSVGTDLARDV